MDAIREYLLNFANGLEKWFCPTSGVAWLKSCCYQRKLEVKVAEVVDLTCRSFDEVLYVG